MESLGERLIQKLNKQRNQFFRRQLDQLNNQRYKNVDYRIDPAG
jgi:hypothetical protein